MKIIRTLPPKWILLLPLILLICFSCKKDNSDDDDGGGNGNTPGNQCYILKVVDDLEEYLELVFTYNGQDQLTRVDATEDDEYDYKTMQYDNEGNMIRIDYYDGDGSLYGYQTFEYSNGRVVSGQEHTYNNASYTYNYNAKGLLESIELMGFKSYEADEVNPRKRHHRGILSEMFRHLSENKGKAYPGGAMQNATIVFEWVNDKNVLKETWKHGDVVIESYDFTYDNKRNPFLVHACPVPLLGGPYGMFISYNNRTVESWYSEGNGETEVSNIAYEYNAQGFPVVMVFDGSDKYRISYKCD